MSKDIGFRKGRFCCNKIEIESQAHKIQRYGLLQKIHDTCQLEFGTWQTLVLFRNKNILNLGKHKDIKGLSIVIDFDFDFTGTTLEPEDYLIFCITDRLGNVTHKKISIFYEKLNEVYKEAMSLINEAIAEQLEDNQAVS